MTNDHWDDDDIDELLLSCITVDAANVDNLTVDDIFVVKYCHSFRWINGHQKHRYGVVI